MGRIIVEGLDSEYAKHLNLNTHFLAEKCSLEHCECEQLFYGIEEDDIEVDAGGDAMNMDNIADEYNAADEYPNMLWTCIYYKTNQ